MLLKKVLLSAVVAVLPSLAAAQVPEYYPADYDQIIQAAKGEGKLVIYAPLDASAVQPLIAEFQGLYPGIQVEFNDLNTSVLHNRFISEAAAGSGTADFLWSSGMDLQFQLVKDGHALSYASPEIPHIPQWAVWENQAYGTTFEPIVFIYNKAELSEDQVPKSHAEVAKKLTEHADTYQDRVANYDIEKSGIGYLTVAQDEKAFPGFWEIPAAFGKVGAKYLSGSGQMIDSIGSGENVFAYNQLGAYARRVADNPDVGVVMPSDYTLVMSRVAFIAKNAPHPNAAKLWLDYILSQRGQTKIMNEAGLYSLRTDLDGDYTAAALTQKLGSSLRPIPIGPEILTSLDPTLRTEFLAKWQQATRGGN